MKKVLIFICSCFCLLTLVGCHSVSELSKANDELKNDNYTVYYQIHKNVTYGKKEVMDDNVEYLVKNNGNQMMLSTWDDEGERYDTYTEILNNEVEVLTKEGKLWYYEETLPLDEYQEPVFLPEVEFNSDNFKYEKELWTGNTELITELLSESLNKKAYEFDSYAGFIDAEISSVVNNYTVELKDNHLYKISCEYQVLVTFVNEKVLTLTETVVAEYSDIASTVLVRPEVFELSYVVEPTDNYTAQIFYEMSMFVPGEEEAVPGLGAEFIMKVDGNLMNMYPEGEEDYFIYVEQNEDEVICYVNQEGEWYKESINLDELDLMTNMTNTPSIEYTPENFKYQDGYWYGNLEAINAACEEYLQEVESMYKELVLANEGEAEVEITEYIMQVEDGVLTGVTMQISMTFSQGENSMTLIQNSSMIFSKIGYTEVEKPEIK